MAVSWPTSSTVTLQELEPGVLYTLNVTAFNAAGNVTALYNVTLPENSGE